jgi:hypothetical protein
VNTESKTIGVELHGVRLNLTGDYAALVEHAATLMEGCVRDPFAAPDLASSVRWLNRPIAEGENLFEDSGSTATDGFGKRMLIGDDELVWLDTHRASNLQLRFRRDDGRPVFDVVYGYAPSPRKLARFPHYEHKKFFDLLRYLVFFPVAWHMERTRGWVLMHASAVTNDDGAVLLAGPGGSGKSTTCVALAAHAGMRFVAENLLFCDGRRVYPIPEPVRLTEKSLELLGQAALQMADRGSQLASGHAESQLSSAICDHQSLRPFTFHGGLREKQMFHLDGGNDPGGLVARAVFLPRFTREGYAELIEPAAACEQLLAINRLTLEVNDYYWYSAALDLVWPKPDNAANLPAVVKRLTQQAACYALGIDRGAGVDGVVDTVVRCLADARSATPPQRTNFELQSAIPSTVECVR